MGAPELIDRWRGRLPEHGYVDLTEDLNQFSELSQAIRPPRFRLRVLESSYVAADGDEDLAVDIQAELVPPDTLLVEPGARGWIHFELATADGVGAIHTLDIPAGIQTGGLGRLVVAQLATLGDELGLEALELEAGKIGRWAWMRCGFDFMDEEARNVAVEAARRFANCLGRQVDLSGIEHSWDFLSLDETVTAEEIREAGGPLIRSPGESISLGKALLLGPNENENAWFGRLSLDAQSAGRVRLEGYVLGHASR